MLQEVTGNNANKITAYYRVNGRIISQQKYNVSQGNNNGYQNRPNGRQLFYGYDGLGSVAALSNHQGKLKTCYQYDAFGEVLAGDLSDNQYTFTGKRLDPESNLYHFHFRNYDAEAGVWTTADPIGVLGGVNLYQYVKSNPVNFRDWLGLCSKTKSNIPHQGVTGSFPLSPTFFGLGGEYPSLGRDNTIISPGSFIGLALEMGLPFGHNFAKIHDAIVLVQRELEFCLV